MNRTLLGLGIVIWAVAGVLVAIWVTLDFIDRVHLGAFGKYWEANWPALLPAIVFLVINPWSIVATYRAASAKRERFRLAQEELIEEVESILVGGGSLSISTIYNLADSRAARRDVKTRRLFRPVEILIDVARRLHANRVLPPRERDQYEAHVHRLIAEHKADEGVQLLDSLIVLLNNESLESRTTAAHQIETIIGWKTFEDASLLNNLQLYTSRSKLRNSAARKRALDLTETLKAKWAGQAHFENELPLIHPITDEPTA